MNPNRSFERGASKKPQSLRQCLSKPFGDETSYKKIWNGYDQEEGEKKVVKVVDHESNGFPSRSPLPSGEEDGVRGSK
jgi:hypothetical protein